MESLTLAEGEYVDFFTRYKAGEVEDGSGVFSPNPAWPLFANSANIPVN
ncbi:MAG: hypothetical protein K2N78_12170 [Oscillospiraceae bacterium]|nr:hypothetical protein [Oscillospiraceae bacterium]